jgi:hypothetical protein
MTIPKIAHEAPLAIITDVDAITDYSYFLVHLFEENADYLKWAKQVSVSGRETLLDNSVFELGTAFNADSFAKWVEEIKPTYYIVPDVLEDGVETIKQFNSFRLKYSNLPGKTIAVAQGKSYFEVVDCYKYLVDKCDKIAISFDYSFFEDWFPNEATKYHKWVKGRQHLLKKMLEEGVIDTSRPHHLLGCGLASEFSFYKNWLWIDSLDTSNPVVAGLKGLLYTEQEGGWSLSDKPSEKLCTLVESVVSEQQKQNIFFNIQKFRENLV